MIGDMAKIMDEDHVQKPVKGQERAHLDRLILLNDPEAADVSKMTRSLLIMERDPLIAVI